MSKNYEERMKGSDNPNFKEAGRKLCKWCGEEFINYNKERKYCSFSCYLKKQRGNKPTKEEMREINCRKRMIKQERRAKQLKMTLLLKHAKTEAYLEIRHCKICDDEFRVYKSQKNITCSEKCLRIHLSERQKGEKSHLWEGGKTSKAMTIRNSAKYSEWRKNVFERDDFICQLCFERAPKLAAHHIKPFAKYPQLRFDISHGITLCWSCHSGIHWKEEEYEEYFIGIINKRTAEQALDRMYVWDQRIMKNKEAI